MKKRDPISINLLNNQSILPYALILPSLIVILAIMAFPLAYSLGRSFLLSGKFVGFENYLRVSDPSIPEVILRSLWFVIICAFWGQVLGLTYALLLNRKFPGQGFVRTLFLLPLLMPPVVSALNWGFLLNNEYGLVNQLLRLIPGVTPPLWLSFPDTAFLSVIIATIWRDTPFVTILLLAGLQAISPELYESAQIDGASKIKTFFYITLPSLKSVILIALMLRVIDLFRVFDIVYVMTQGGPGGATDLLSTKIYKLAFWDVQTEAASALAYIALIITLITLVPLLLASRKEENL